MIDSDRDHKFTALLALVCLSGLRSCHLPQLPSQAPEANTKKIMSGIELPPGAVVLTLKELESSLGVLFVGMSAAHSQLVGTNSVV